MINRLRLPNSYNPPNRFSLVGGLCLAIFAFHPLAQAEIVQVQGVDQFFACGPLGCGGIFQGMIGGTVDSQGALVGGKLVKLICIDYQNDTYIPSAAYSANISSVSGSDFSLTRHGGSPQNGPLGPWSFSNTKFGNLTLADDTSSAQARYQMAAFLVSRYNTGGDNNAIQSAIWQVMSATAPAVTQGPVLLVQGSTGWLNAAADWYLNSASTQAGQKLLNSYQVVTNVNPQIAGPYPGQVQEFMTLSPVPEPTYLVPLAIGCGIMVLLGRRKRV